MIDSLIKADKECIEHEDVNPGKVLRPIGSTLRTWQECKTSTEQPHWANWKVTGYRRRFRGRQDKTLFYERMEEVRLN